MLEEQHENFVTAVKKCEREQVRHFLHKRVTKKFHVVVVQNNGKEMYKKSVLQVKSCFFAN